MTELTFIHFFLAIAFVLAPLMTGHFFLSNSKSYSNAHKVTLLILLIGAVLNFNYLSVVWPLFCAFGFFLFVKNEHRSLLSIGGLAPAIPFVFSLISATWFFSGVNDLHLLGYNKAWSFYAALHGSFLGWMFVGCLAFLSQRPQASKFYLWGCYLCLILFLLVAVGIDGVPYVKRIGVVGLSFVVPFLIGLYAFSLRNKNKTSLYLAAVSLFSLIVTMTLAVLNEFWVDAPRIAFGIPIMVFAHGLMNAIITIPCFILAIRFER